MNDTNDTKKFELKTKSLFLTYPQCPEDKKELLEYLREKGAKQAVVAMEKHENGDPHLHAYATWDTAKKFRERTMDWKGYHPNMQSCKNYLAVIKYVKKDQDYIEYGMDTEAYKRARESKKSIVGAKLISREITVEDAVKDNPELIFQYGTLKKNVETYLLNTTPAENFERVNYWIVGKPGCGKSQWAHRNCPNLYKKAQNKWWDGYRGEAQVLIEDMDTNLLGHYLKIWGDNYHCTGETKGGTVPLRHKTMIVTSNYLISHLWENDPIMAEAIARRFKTYTVEGTYEEGYNLKDIGEWGRPY